MNLNDKFISIPPGEFGQFLTSSGWLTLDEFLIYLDEKKKESENG